MRAAEWRKGIFMPIIYIIPLLLQCFIHRVASQSPYTTWLEDTIAVRSIYQNCDGKNWRVTWSNLDKDPCIHSKTDYQGVTCDLYWSTNFIRLDGTGGLVVLN